jgi:hypothetical protein
MFYFVACSRGRGAKKTFLSLRPGNDNDQHIKPKRFCSRPLVIRKRFTSKNIVLLLFLSSVLSGDDCGFTLIAESMNHYHHFVYALLLLSFLLFCSFIVASTHKNLQHKTFDGYRP